MFQESEQEQLNRARGMLNANAANVASNPFVTNNTGPQLGAAIQPGRVMHQGMLQGDLFATTGEINVQITKAENGHIVRVAKGQGYLSSTWIVPDGQVVTDVIAAAIAKMSLEQSK